MSLISQTCPSLRNAWKDNIDFLWVSLHVSFKCIYNCMYKSICIHTLCFNNTQTWHLTFLKKRLLWLLWLYLWFHRPTVLISVGVWPSGWLVGTRDAVKLKSSPVLQRKQWNKTCNNPKMSTQTSVFVRVTRFQSKPHSSLQFCILREGEPDGFDAGECAQMQLCLLVNLHH